MTDGPDRGDQFDLGQTTNPDDWYDSDEGKLVVAWIKAARTQVSFILLFEDLWSRARERVAGNWFAEHRYLIDRSEIAAERGDQADVAALDNAVRATVRNLGYNPLEEDAAAYWTDADIGEYARQLESVIAEVTSLPQSVGELPFLRRIEFVPADTHIRPELIRLMDMARGMLAEVDAITRPFRG